MPTCPGLKRILLASLLLSLILVSVPIKAYERKALLIGNSNYSSPGEYLSNPCQDANSLAKVLKDQMGFSARAVCDLDRRAMHRELKQFYETINRGDIALFYYSGHGLGIDQQNYMLPVDHNAETQQDVAVEGYALDQVVSDLRRRNATLNVLLLDACRSSALPSWSKSTFKGLARQDAPPGTIIGFATQAGSVAANGDGENSPYAQALIQVLPTPGLSVPVILNRVGMRTMELTANAQIPWVSSNPVPEIHLFAKREVAVSAISIESAPTDNESEYGSVVINQLPTNSSYSVTVVSSSGTQKFKHWGEGVHRIPKPLPYGAYIRIEISSPGYQDHEEEFVIESKTHSLLYKPIASKQETKKTTENFSIITQVQQELTRIGLSPGPSDGKWGQRGKAALALLKLMWDSTLPNEASQSLHHKLKAIPRLSIHWIEADGWVYPERYAYNYGSTGATVHYGIYSGRHSGDGKRINGGSLNIDGGSNRREDVLLKRSLGFVPSLCSRKDAISNRLGGPFYDKEHKAYQVARGLDVTCNVSDQIDRVLVLPRDNESGDKELELKKIRSIWHANGEPIRGQGTMYYDIQDIAHYYYHDDLLVSFGGQYDGGCLTKLSWEGEVIWEKCVPGPEGNMSQISIKRAAEYGGLGEYGYGILALGTYEYSLNLKGDSVSATGTVVMSLDSRGRLLPMREAPVRTLDTPVNH